MPGAVGDLESVDPGSITSRTTRSGRCSRALSRPSSPDASLHDTVALIGEAAPNAPSGSSGRHRRRGFGLGSSAHRIWGPPSMGHPGRRAPVPETIVCPETLPRANLGRRRRPAATPARLISPFRGDVVPLRARPSNPQTSSQPARTRYPALPWTSSSPDPAPPTRTDRARRRAPTWSSTTGAGSASTWARAASPASPGSWSQAPSTRWSSATCTRTTSSTSWPLRH